MSEQSITAIIISIIPALLVYFNENRKINKDSSLTVYDKQKDWIEKLENELEEREVEINELKTMIGLLEKRIKELEDNL